MKKILCTVLFLTIYQISFAPPEEEETQTTEVTTHKSLDDDSWANIFRRAKNTIGDRFGFGDLHKAKTLLAKPQAARTDEENTQLADSFRNLDSREKTEAINEAAQKRQQQNESLQNDQTQNKISQADQISNEVFQHFKKSEVVTKNDDGSITVHNTAKSPLKKEQELKCINDYLKDPNSPLNTANVIKILSNTTSLQGLTDGEQKQLIPNAFKLSKLAGDPERINKLLIDPYKEQFQNQFRHFTNTSIQEFMDNPKDPNALGQAKILLNAYKNSDISHFFDEYFANPADQDLEAIQKLIGPDNIIIDCDLNNPIRRKMIINKNDPIFIPTDKAINVLRYLSDPKLAENNKEAIRIILKKYMKDISPKDITSKEFTKILTNIKNENDEILIENQLININDPEKSLTTLSPSELAEKVITTLANKQELSPEEKTALTTFARKTYDQNYQEWTKIIKKIPLTKVLEAIKQPNEIIIDDQLVNINDPLQTRTTLSAQKLIETVITQLANKQELSPQEEIALTNSIKTTYDQNPKMLARIMDKLPEAKIEPLLSKLSRNIRYIRTKEGIVLFDTNKFNLTTPTKQQAAKILQNVTGNDPSPESVYVMQRFITRYFKTELNITDLESAQIVWGDLITKKTEFDPEIFKSIFNEMKIREQQQRNFFKKQYQKIYTEARNLSSQEKQLPQTTTNEYGEEETTNSPYSTDINRLESLENKLKQLISEKYHKP